MDDKNRIMDPWAAEKNFNLSDFAFFLSVMKNREAYENTLSIIMDDPDLELKEVHVEHVVLNHSGKRAIRLDAWAIDRNERRYNTEMENDISSDDIRKRSRFYQGLLDTPILKSGRKTRYRQLPSTVIIFITQDDIFGKDLAAYTFTEQCEEIAGMHLEDGTTKIFLNMSSRNGRPELVSLLQYMKETRTDNLNNLMQDPRLGRLAEIVEEVRESEEWEEVRMSIYSDGITRGMIVAKQDAIIEFLSERGTVPEDLTQKIHDTTDLDLLGKWMKMAARAESVEDFAVSL